MCARGGLGAPGAVEALVDQAVVAAAGELAVVQGGQAVVGPGGLGVVAVAPGGGTLAALDVAVAVLADRHREALGLGEPTPASHVQGLGGAAEHDGDDPGL